MKNLKNITVIGKNAFAVKDNQVVIGNFSEEDFQNKIYNDCVIMHEGLVIVKKDVFEFLGIKIYTCIY